MHKDVGKRIMALLLSFCMIAGMMDLSGFTVRAADEDWYISGVTLKDTANKTYDGSQKSLGASDVIVTVADVNGLNERDLSEAEVSGGCTFTYSDTSRVNVKTGGYQVTISGIEDMGYHRSRSVYFDIVPKEFTVGNVTISGIENKNAIENTPVSQNVTVMDSTLNRPLTPGTDYRIEYVKNSVTADDGPSAQGSINIIGQGNYNGTINKTFTITKIDAANLSITLKNDGILTWASEQYGYYYALYNGSKRTLGEDDITVTYNSSEIPFENLQLIYSPDRNEGYVGDIKVKARVTEGDYAGLETQEVSFRVVRSLGSQTVTPITITGLEATCGEDGSWVVNYDNATFYDPAASTEVAALPAKEKFLVEVNTSGLPSTLPSEYKGTCTVKINANAANVYYIGNMQADIILRTPRLTDDMIHILDNGTEKREYEFDGSTNWPQKIVDEMSSRIRVGSADAPYVQGTDYTVKVKSSGVNANQGNASYYITVTPSGNRLQGDPIDVPIKVTPMPLDESGKITMVVPSAEYTGSAVTPSPITLSYMNGNNQSTNMVLNQDYTISTYGNNIEAGELTAYVRLVGTGNFSGTYDKKFTITPKTLSAGNTKINDIEAEYEYEGRAIEPSLTIRVDDITYVLQKDRDYTVTYSNDNGTDSHENVNDGNITMTITGKGNFQGGNLTKTFKIVPRALNNIDIRANYTTSWEYTGQAIQPEIALTFQRSGVTKTLVQGVDYNVNYNNNKNVTTAQSRAEVTVTGTENFKDSLTYYFDITPCNLATTPNLTVEAEDITGAIKELTAQRDGEAYLDFYYFYTGNKIPEEGNNLRNLTIKHNGNQIASDDYKVTYENNTNIGQARLIISGTDTNNYSGSKTLYYAIKGDLSDYTISGRTNIEIESEEYTKDVIVPTKVTVTYRTEEETMTLVRGTDYEVENASQTSQESGISPVGSNEMARITGKGLFVNSAEKSFTVEPLSLDKTRETLENDHKYVIDKVKEQYTYSGLPITPEPEITHSGKPVEETTEYLLEYYAYANGAAVGTKIDDIEDGKNFQVGSHYGLKIIGETNYVDSIELPYAIVPYNLKTDGFDEGRIEILNTADAVVLDHVKYPGSTSSELLEGDDLATNMELDENGQPIEDTATDEIVWKDLQVMYTPVDIEGNTVTGTDGEVVRYALEYGVDYTVEYKDNTEPGEATYTIKGVAGSNFTGEIEQTFRILADLSSENTTVEAANCTFKPSNDPDRPANEPEVTVEYLLKMIEGEDRTIVLSDMDPEPYAVTYANNSQATKGPEGMEDDEQAAPEHDTANLPTATVTASDDGFVYGSKSATFDIYQRVLSDEEDSGLSFEETLEYEYTGAPIIPDINISCEGVALVREDSGTTPYDYGITAENNENVWTFDGAGNRLNPTATISARKGETEENKDKYTGNYFGEFQKVFEITARHLDKEAADVILEVVNNRTDLYTLNETTGEWECEYDREPVTFPETGDQVPYPTSNGLSVTWKKGTTVAELREGTDYLIRYEDNVKIGDAKIWIEAPDDLHSNYTGSYDQHFKIMATIAEVDNDNPVNGVRYMELVGYGKDDRPEIYYSVVEAIPELIFEDISAKLEDPSAQSKILEKDTDFVILTQQNCSQYGETEYSTNNVNVSGENETAKLVIKGIGYYTGIVKREYKIVPKDFSDEMSGITVQFVGSKKGEGYENGYIYNGQAQRPTVKVFNNNIKDLENPDYNPFGNSTLELKPNEYTIVGYENNTELSTEDNPAYVIIQGNGPNYTGTYKFPFQIIRKPIDEATIQVTENPVYDGTAKEPVLDVSYMDGTRRVTLEAGTDYEVAYENNVEAASANAEEAPPTVILSGIGGYGGVARINFTIEPRNIADEESIIATGSAMYTGGEVTPRVSIVDNGVPTDRARLQLDVDYTMVNQTPGVTEPGATGRMLITGQGNYTGSRTVVYRVITEDGEFQIDSIEAQEYNTRPIRPSVRVSLLVKEIDEPIELIEGMDYDLTYSNNQNAGVATVTAVGKDIFEGQRVSATFAINPKSIGADGVVDASMTIGDIRDYQYTGTAIVPVVDLKFQPFLQGTAREGEEDTDTPISLVVGRDYQVTCTNNTGVGMATATITGIGNYSGTITRDFRILGNMNMVTVAPIPTQQYTGSPVTPTPLVSLGGVALVEGTHYTVEYRNNTERGTATIILTGIGEWYSGSKTVTFDIARELSASTSIRGVAAAYTYTGAAITPPVRVEDDGTLLVNGVDYQLSYEQNINAGTATIIIAGINRYSGSRSVTFQITPQQLGRATVSPVAEQTYDGKEKNPSVTVTSGSTTLQNGKDYTLVYVNSSTPGMASIIIKGEGNYTGTQTINYNIAVPGVTGVKTSKYTNKSITLSWTKNSVVSGYEIYNSKNRREVRITKASTVKGTISKLKAGTGATYRVRAYVNKDGQYYYGPFTSIKTATAPNSTKISSIASSKSKRVTLKWKKVSGATQYEIYRSTKSKTGYKKIATTKKISYTDTKATGGKKYYYKIRVCKKISNKNYYSSYSAVKSIKAKK